MVAPLVKKVDWDEEKGSEGGHLGADRVKDEISMSAQLLSNFWVMGLEGFGAFG